MKVSAVLETCLYAPDLAAAEAFYGGILGLEGFAREAGRHVFFRCGPGVLLIFDPDSTGKRRTHVGGVPIPLHGAHGAGHVAFAVSETELPGWERRLREAGVEIEAEVEWPNGGRSLYVRDPAGNSVELAPPTIWGG